MILAARAEKPVWAVANTFAASAAYALGGSASQLYVPRLALVGSIGAVCVHVDQSAQDAAYGERYTAIYSGARKIDGWEHAALSADAKASFQAGVDHCRDQFAELVGKQGRMTKAQAIATEAGIYHDQEAVEAGLADRVGSFDQALADLTAELNGSSPRAAGAASTSTQETGMSKIVQSGAAKGNNGTSTTALNLKPAAATPDVRADAADGDEPTGDDDDADPNAEQEMTAPQPGEKCALCGQTMPDNSASSKAADGDGNTDPDSPEEARAHAQHAAAANLDISARLGEIDAIMDLCASQNVSLADARGFIKSKTSLADVRTKIAAGKAAASDALDFDTRQPPQAKNTEARVEQMRTAQKAVKENMKSRFAK
nr:S49 family peptidase [Bradyrhizobium manausense]